MKGISINNLTFQYRKGIKVFDNFSIELKSPEDKGHAIVVMGASGAGKSTLLKLFLGIESAGGGTIVLYPKNPVISYVPQEPVLFEHLSVKDNARYFKFAGANKARFNEQLYRELIVDLDLEDVIEKSKSVTELSGGQKQRLSLLRALSINPDFLLLDEPCNGLDAEVKRSFLNKLREITEHYRLFVLYITHHKLEAQLIADEVVFLKQNRNTGSVDLPIKGAILDFIEAPPILEAAHVFNFPTVNILPIAGIHEGHVEIATNKDLTLYYWLIKDEHIAIDNSTGWDFTVISKSPVFSVIRHLKSNIEWMLGSDFFKAYKPGDEIKVKVKGKFIQYDKNGLIERDKVYSL